MDFTFWKRNSRGLCCKTSDSLIFVAIDRSGFYNKILCKNKSTNNQRFESSKNVTTYQKICNLLMKLTFYISLRITFIFILIYYEHEKPNVKTNHWSTCTVQCQPPNSEFRVHKNFLLVFVTNEMQMSNHEDIDLQETRNFSWYEIR